MKNLNRFILENDAELLKQLEEIAWGVIDFLNQEGVKDFDEQDWKKYVNGDKEPDYEVVVKAMVYDASRYPKIEKELDKYPNTDLKEDIQLSILRAAKDYLKGVE